jgi:hypothetical protein
MTAHRRIAADLGQYIEVHRDSRRPQGAVQPFLSATSNRSPSFSPKTCFLRNKPIYLRPRPASFRINPPKMHQPATKITDHQVQRQTQFEAKLRGKQTHITANQTHFSRIHRRQGRVLGGRNCGRVRGCAPWNVVGKDCARAGRAAATEGRRYIDGRPYRRRRSCETTFRSIGTSASVPGYS